VITNPIFETHSAQAECFRSARQKQHIVSFSGGLCSYWAGKRVVAEEGPGACTLLFADTNMEDEDLYRFVSQGAADIFGWGKEVPAFEAVRQLALDIGEAAISPEAGAGRLVITADGRTPWQIFFDEHFLGNSRIDPCSKLLKRERLWRWMRANCTQADSVTHVGLDWTEGHRLERLRNARPGWQIEAPMQTGELWDKRRMGCELAAVGIEIPRLYKLGFPHNNCGGFCIKAGQAHFAHLLKVLPERYKSHEDMEQEIRAVLGDVSIMKRVVKGVPQRLTLRQLREEIEAGKEYDGLEWGGCGCAVDTPEEEVTA
jgi:hypothetical protein